MKRTIILLAFASIAASSMAVQTAKAMGCMEGAAIGGVAGHMAHHTFLGIFGGCAGGLVVHHMYTKWKQAHPNGSMQEFVADNKDKLPAGWADRLNSAGPISLTAGHQ
jgi:hypothetical protein